MCLFGGLKFRMGEVIWGVISPKAYFQSENLRRTADYLGSLIMLVQSFGGLRKLLNMSTPIPKVNDSPSPPTPNPPGYIT